MKTSLFAGMMVALFGLLTGGDWNFEKEAIWNGPRSSVEWVGLVAPQGVTAVMQTRSGHEPTLEQMAPAWVGYFKRGNDWRVRLVPYGQQEAETLRRYATTSDGWKVVDIVVRGNRVQSVLVEKEQTQITLEIQQ